jgi:uridine kinase
MATIPLSKRVQASVVRPGKPRETVQVRFPDGQLYEAPIGTPLEAFMEAGELNEPAPIVAALVDGELRELTYRVTGDVSVTPVTMANTDGMRIYRRSLTLLLVTAAHELFPEAEVYVDYSVTFGGYFCDVRGRPDFTPEELGRLEKRMWELVQADLPITREEVPLDRAIAIFKERGERDMLRLLTNRRKDYLTMYTLRDTQDWFHGYMVPSTGYLRYFALEPYPGGFILRFPRQSAPTTIQPVRDYPKLTAVWREYGQWQRVIGVEDVGALNEAIVGGRIDEVILVAEALHAQRIAAIASEIAEAHDRVRLVLVAGPSSSGKTTFTRRLAVQLLANGVRPVAISLDNYFVERTKTPRDINGDYNFEALEALDLALFNEHLLRLLDGDEVTLPRYDFVTGTRQVGDTLSITPDHVILVEGIHGLNPRLVPQVPPEYIFRVYVSALTHLNLDRHNRISTTDTRLIRRMVRDARTRNYRPYETIQRWDSVRRGEEQYIFPYQEHANVMFNSALVYEMAVLKPLAEPLLREVKPGTLEYVEARRLLAFLEWFLPCPADVVPSNSILREFVGGSILERFEPWRRTELP